MLGTKADVSTVRGEVAPGFERVEEAFKENFAKRREYGAACAVYHRGEKVVDLWGGYRDLSSERPWEEDTLVLMYSTTKGVAAMSFAVANSRGLLDYDEKVSTYWPEFGQHGKEDITVRQLLAHQAGLCVVDETLDLEALSDLDALAELLARQRPAWDVGSKHGYHHFCLGLYQNELMRRIDPQHRTVGNFLREEISEPLGVEFYIGLPLEIPDSRLAIVETTRPLDILLHLREVPLMFTAAILNPRSMTSRTMSNPPMLSGKATDFDRRETLAVEMPSANGVGEVRGLAKLYGEFANGGTSLNIRRETLDELEAPPVDPTSGLRDVVLLGDTVVLAGVPQAGRRFRVR